MPAVVAHTIQQAVAVLGGPSKVARVIGCYPNAVQNWLKRGTFPPETFHLLAPRLKKAGCEFSPKLFRQYIVGSKPPDPSRQWRRASRARKTRKRPRSPSRAGNGGE